MDLGLHGKTAIVTGASRGIGLAIASALHREGVSLVLVARSHDTLSKVARDLTAREGSAAPPVHPIAADLGIRAEVERVAAQAIVRLGHVDILVNNAAQAQTGSFFEMSEDDWQAVWQVKAFGYVRMVAAISRHMMERESGSIINIIGTAARTPTEDFIIGGMVNAALLNFTRGIARILGHKNVRINSISPGWTRTEGQQRHLEMVAAAQGRTVEEVERREARGVPLGRLVTMEEIAEMALLLASGRVPAMTGEDIIIDGGATPSI